MAPLIPLACLAFVNNICSSPFTTRNMSSSNLAAAVSSLPSLNSSDGSAMQPNAVANALKGKRVALYFAAGWCPMCTSFEPSLLKFRAASESSKKNVEIIYVPSDRSETDVITRTTAMNMMSVPIGEEADAMKKKYKIWAGAECRKLGTDRRSGVPALVVIESKKGDELAFLAAESQGAGALGSWPLDDEYCVW